MLALIQRVTSAKIEIDECIYGEIGQGLLVFLGIEKNDSNEDADRLLKKVLAYRIFSDIDGKMNLSVSDVGGGLLLVSQFTLVADTEKGLRPSFSKAMPSQGARSLYNYFVTQAKNVYVQVATGKFAADMKVSLTNDGPVTFMLKS